ncbi:exonuclease domain-containing protein [Sphingobacterium sp. UBA5996]|uniref:exonuclease domain-containing protein n=1 Tax=Sphingobacterium sp. UBA5996 TaxID=1947505 RepID=UPI0025E3D63E|nr:exonuclease domain-containing protein [Sphingobacterium sp. UBA5996]
MDLNQSKKQEYAIVDIETTGGHAKSSRITEVAIVIHDGNQVLERWETLVNPGKEIPNSIFALTGIDNDMVKDAPTFEEVAERIYAMLKDRIFVAHNVNFDYSFIRFQLQESGFEWSAIKLCTVRYARKIKPGLLSYSLGRLCDYLDIPIENRHRAGGDADATAILFAYLKVLDTEQIFQYMIKHKAIDQRFPPHLNPLAYEQLPSEAGVYYFHDKDGKVIYVGKAVNIKKRVLSHFTGNNIQAQRQNFLKEIHHISYECCGTELIALLLECAEIKRFWPKYNRALKRYEPKFGLFSYEDQNGYLHLAIGKTNRGQACIQVFQREYDAIQLLQTFIQQDAINPQFCQFGQASLSTKSIKKDVLPDRDLHNTRIERCIEEWLVQRPSYVLIDKGRHSEEKSCIVIENGAFYGMGYIDQFYQNYGFEDIKAHVKRYPSNYYMMELVKMAAARHPGKIHFLTESTFLPNSAAEPDFHYEKLEPNSLFNLS